MAKQQQDVLDLLIAEPTVRPTVSPPDTVIEGVPTTPSRPRRRRRTELDRVDRIRFWAAAIALWMLGTYLSWLVLTAAAGLSGFQAAVGAIIIQSVLTAGELAVIRHRNLPSFLFGIIFLSIDAFLNALGLDLIVPAIALTIDVSSPILWITFAIGVGIAIAPEVLADTARE